MFKKTLLSAAALLAAGTLSASVFAAPTTVEGTGVGKHGDITVAVTFDAGKILLSLSLHFWSSSVNCLYIITFPSL